MLYKNTYKCLEQYDTCRLRKYKHEPCHSFNYFESGAQAFAILDMPQFHKYLL